VTIATLHLTARFPITKPGDKLPRHIHKLFTLSIIYSLAFRGLLGLVGITLGDGEKDCNR